MRKERKSYRLKNWDYRSEGLYFITICTKDRAPHFGKIMNGKMIFSPAGAIANVLWFELAHRNEKVTLGEFVVMPNHIHGIIKLNNVSGICRDVARNVSTNIDNTSNINEQMSKISPKSGSLSTIIRSYKSAVAKHCNRLNLEFSWQSRFHDHIIRDDASFQKISQYIMDNTLNWKEDIFNNTIDP